MNIFLILIISSILVVEISGEIKFCEKNRVLLLGGVFNYDRIFFCHSWIDDKRKVKEDNENTPQLMLAWRYELKNNQFVPIGRDSGDVTVDQIFPTIPMFKSGFGLTMKCDGSDTTCKSYRQLVFIFFQNSYKVFRFANDVFAEETDNSKIPWGLKKRGYPIDWHFGNGDMDGVNAIMFMSGYQSQIFVVSKEVLYVSPVDIKAPALKWTKLAQSKDFGGALGGFVIGSDLYINRKEESDSFVVKYDESGKELEKIPVLKYFGCDANKEEKGAEHGEAGVETGQIVRGESDEQNEKNNSLAAIIMICVLVVIVLTNVVTGLFWLTVYRRKTTNTEV